MKTEEMKNYKSPVVKVVNVHIESAILESSVHGTGKDGEDDGEI